MSRAVVGASWAAAALAAHAAYNATRLRVPPEPPASQFAPLVSVLIPTRDEAPVIGACLDAVLASRGVVLEVLVLDDESSDATASVVAGYAARDRRVRLVPGQPLPAGWLGKPHACAQLAAQATGRLLAFVDADVVVAPDALVRSAALLDAAELDLVSPYPRQVAATPSERLVQPLLQWSWLTFLPLRLAEVLPNPSLVAANGQFLLCRRESYDAAGGHAGVRAAVIEDVALARAFKRAGLRATVADGTGLASCRMYTGWDEVRDGYSKSLWATSRTAAGAAATTALLAWLYVLPPAAAAARALSRRSGVVTPALGYAAGVAGRVVSARRTGGSTRDAVLHPLSVLVLLWLQWRSRWLHRSGRLRWKGRPIA